MLSARQFIVFAGAIVAMIATVTAVTPDKHDACEDWADSGECDKNPGWMLENCATSCDDVSTEALLAAKELEGITSFFDLSANDIRGNTLDFSDFRGDVTVLINVASQCGYTDSHYKGMVQLWNDHLEPVKKASSSGSIHLLAFPCNQFGQQEPGTATQIEEFAVKNYGVHFTIMEKVDVNGPNASVVYKYLKREAGPNHIGWNFATYYVVSPDGKVTSHSGVEPMELKDTILGLAGEL